MLETCAKLEPASFRDPDGFVYRSPEGMLLRQVNQSYASAYRYFVDSGLYNELVENNLLVPHEEVGLDHRLTDDALTILRPKNVSFVSYPYEWCFSQLKAAALLTLDIQKRALDHGMSMKDCSAYNVLFDGAKPVFIDTLSFEPYQAGHPWVAYRQFCRHFLAPLALMSYRDMRLNGLFRVSIDGVPLDMASALLPKRTWMRLGLLTHLHFHASLEKKDAARQRAGHTAPVLGKATGKVSETGLRGLIDNLEVSIRKLNYKQSETEWSNYYSDNTYTDSATERKEALVAEWTEQVRPNIVWDLGANTGRYSRIAAAGGAFVIAFDIDWRCVDEHYMYCFKEGRSNILPLCLDLANPSSGLGWGHRERASLADRGPADLVLALALVHHLAIGNNVPFPLLAEYFSLLAKTLIIEFVPKDDPQTQRLLESRKDIFSKYTRIEFERVFKGYFDILQIKKIPDSSRVLYLMKRCERQ